MVFLCRFLLSYHSKLILAKKQTLENMFEANFKHKLYFCFGGSLRHFKIKHCIWSLKITLNNSFQDFIAWGYILRGRSEMTSPYGGVGGGVFKR